jgi:hypothetical protein
MIMFLILYGTLFLMGVIEVIPNSETLNKWDAGFYSSIKDQGYIYHAGQAGNVGFYPFFPYFWKCTLLSPLGISILNGLVYLISLAFLCKLLKPDVMVLGFFMSMPFMFFMFTPHSESLFFLFSTCIIYGIVKKNEKPLFVLSLFFASVTRAVFIFFIPAFIGMTIMSNSLKTALDKDIWKEILTLFFLPVLAGFITVGVIQYIQTGNLFAYYEIQAEVWGRKFGWPVFPLGRTSEHPWLVRLSQLNLWIGMLASVMGLKHLINWLKNDGITESDNKHEFFSIIYLTMSFLSILFFNPEWYWVGEGGYNGTFIAGINRYMQANAFMFVFLIYGY